MGFPLEAAHAPLNLQTLRIFTRLFAHFSFYSPRTKTSSFQKPLPHREKNKEAAPKRTPGGKSLSGGKSGSGKFPL